jgi:hypothetical protein
MAGLSKQAHLKTLHFHFWRGAHFARLRVTLRLCRREFAAVLSL